MGDVYKRKYGHLLDEHEGYKKLSNNIIADLNAKIAKLTEALSDIREIYAGSEGIPIPETAAEAYVLRLVQQMYETAVGALQGDKPVVKLYTPYPGHCMKVPDTVFRHLCDNTNPCC